MNLFSNVNQQATTWVKDMMTELPTHDSAKALRALRAGLQALRDRLTVDESAQLAAQLPLLMRGLFFEGWDPSGNPRSIGHRGEYLALVMEKYGPREEEEDVQPERIVAALFRVLARRVSVEEHTGEIA